MSGNSLFSVIYRRKLPLTNQTKLRLLTDIARGKKREMRDDRRAHSLPLGLAFLHSNTPPIAHRDLKTANVLVDEAVTVAKIADFGTAKVSKIEERVGETSFHLHIPSTGNKLVSEDDDWLSHVYGA